MAAIDIMYLKDYYVFDEFRLWCLIYNPKLLKHFYHWNLTQQELIDMINGTKQHQFKYKFYREGIEIYSDNPVFKEEPILLIRGWGYLTGTGGLHLSSEEAIRIQDEFGDYIVEQLNT